MKRHVMFCVLLSSLGCGARSELDGECEPSSSTMSDDGGLSINTKDCGVVHQDGQVVLAMDRCGDSSFIELCHSLGDHSDWVCEWNPSMTVCTQFCECVR